MQDDCEDKAGVQDVDNCLCRLKDIVKWYPPDRLVLDQFSLEIGRGERVMIRGNAGSGRTTLIRILDHKIKPNEGTLLCRGSIAAIYETTGILESMTLRRADCPAPFVSGIQQTGSHGSCFRVAEKDW